MRIQVLHRAPASRPPASLAARGGLARTFGGLATFLVVSFLCSGIYMLEDVFANPIAAQAAALICGAFVIALATILLYYLIRPGTAPRRNRQKHELQDAPQPESGFMQELTLSARREDGREDLAYQRVYVDHSRIRR
jgi:hypothetical protein